MFERFITRLAFILFGIIVFMAISNTAKANNIYIDQAGDNFDLTIDQKGENNMVIGTTTGANNTVTLNQGYEGFNGIGLDIDGDNNDVTVKQERTANGG